MITKLLLWVFAVVAVVFWLRGSGRRSAGARRVSKDTAGADAAAHATPGQAVQSMVRCAHCGMHLTSADAVMHKGQPYCGLAHRLAGPRAPFAQR